MSTDKDAESLAAIVQKSAKGDVEAFGRLYDTYVDRVYRYATCLSGNRTDAEDLTEEVFMKAWDKLPTFRGPQEAFLSWLLRVAHNHVVDSLRRQPKQSVLLSQVEEEDLPAGDTGTDSVEWHVLGRDALRLVTHLPPQQRQVVSLKFIEGLTNREISAVTGQSEGAIRICQMRALQGLRVALDSG